VSARWAGHGSAGDRHGEATVGRRVKRVCNASRGSLTRRQLLALGLAGAGSLAMGRTPYGGRLDFSVPFSLRRLDPHESNDPAAALFAATFAEPLFARTPNGVVYPTLADGLPEFTKDGCVVRLREGIRTGHGRLLTNKDLSWSLQRSLLRGARAVLGPFGEAKRHPEDKYAVIYPSGEPQQIAEALCSPLCAVVPRTFSSQKPDGAGPFVAELNDNRLRLRRSLTAARGPAYLDSIEVQSSSNLAEGLRRFEAGESDLGWLGRGLHAPRKDSKLVDAGMVGWVVLHSGKQAGRWGAPGAAGQLLGRIGAAQLERFGLGVIAQPNATATYGGDECELITRNDSTYMKELGRAVSELLSNGTHKVKLKPVPADELSSRKDSRDFCFLLDVTRALGPSPQEQQLSLLQEANPQLARRAPPLPPGLEGPALVRRVTAPLSLAALGELRVVVAQMPNLQDLGQWELGSAWLRPPRSS